MVCGLDRGIDSHCGLASCPVALYAQARVAAGNVLNIELLGEFRLVVGDQTVEVPRASARIVAWLALQPARGASRNSACAQLWPDLDDRAARSRLSQGLWRIRQVLPDGFELVDAVESDVQLDPGVTTDVDALRKRSALAGSSEMDASSWEALGRPLLEAWDDPWVVDFRADLRRTLDGAMSREVESLGARNDHHGALVVARTRTELFPHDEPAWRSLLSIHDHMGDVADARRTFTRMVERLLEIGASPSPDLTAAHERRDATVEVEASAPAAERIVGRGAERAELIDALEVAAEGFGTTMIVEGESGIGKTRLLDQFEGDARWRGVRIGRAQCSDVETPLRPICAAIEEALAPIEVAALVDTLDKPWLGRAVELLPGLPWPPNAVDSGADTPFVSADEDDRRVQALIEVIASVAQRRLVGLVLDDVHLADRWTMAALHRLTELSGDLALLLVVGYRTESEKQSGELRRLDALANSRRLSLRGLNLRGTYEMARQLDERITRSGAGELMSAGGGNPFLIRHLIARIDGTDDESARASLSVAGGDPISEKLSARSSIETEVVQILAVAEGSLGVFGLTAVCAASSPESVAEAVLALVADGLVIERRGRYETAHDRVRVAALASIPASSLQRIASELIRSKEQGETPAAAARLATRAGDWARAVTAHRAAGREAQRLGAVPAASEHYSAAVEAARLAGLDDHEMVELLLDLHDLYVLAGDVDFQRETLVRLNKLNLRDRWSAVELRTGWQHLDDGRDDMALASAQRVIDGGQSPMSRRGSAHRLRAEARLASGGIELSLIELQEALDADDGGDAGLTAELFSTLANAQLVASDSDLGSAALRRAIAVLERAELLDQLIDAQRQLGMSLVHSGETDDGFEAVQSALRLAQRLGDRRRQSHCQCSLGSAHFALLDRYALGRPYHLEALELAISVRHHMVMANAANNLGFGEAVIVGRVSAGIDYLEQAIEWARDGRQASWSALTTYSRGEVAARVGDEETAFEMYRAAEQLFVALGSPQPLETVLGDLAALHARIGDFTEADRLAARAVSVARSNSHEETGALLEASLGEVCSLRGDAVGALAHARRVASGIRPGVHERHYLLSRAAKLFRTHSMDDEADVHLGLAFRYLRRCIDDFEPRLRGEVVAHHSPLIREATAMAERCTVVMCEEGMGTPAGMRLDLTGDDLTGVQQADSSRAAVVAEIATRSRETGLRPSLTHLAELFDASEASLRREFGSLNGAKGLQFAP